MAEKEVEDQEVFSKFDNGQRQKKIKKKKRCQDQQNQKVLLQVCWLCILSGDKN